jgi:hypothetical protein
MSDGVPQFTRAEYSEKVPETACKACGQPMGGAYYQVNGVMTCAKCAQRVKDKLLQDSHAYFGRGILFGIGGAILGFAIYVGFALATGLMIGYVSLAVGYIVGKAIVTGSAGRGGRRYQVAAVLLTYMAVSLAAVPIVISQMKQHSAQQRAQAGNSAAVNPPKMSAGKALGVLSLVGLASPFLALSNPLQGIIGLIILFVGIRIAWKMTAAAPMRILGPISAAVPAAPG